MDALTANAPMGRSLTETLGSIDREIAGHLKSAEAMKKEAQMLLERAQDHERVAAELKKAREKLNTLDVKMRPIHPGTIIARKRERKGSNAWKVRHYAMELISSAGRPLGRAELFDGLTKMGLEIDAVKPAKAIAQILWAAEEFEYKNKGYWIAGRPIPEGYRNEKRFKAPKGKTA